MNKDAYKFIDWVINQAFEGCDADGGDIQDQAEACGLLKKELVTEPCGENCNCTDYGDFPMGCYQKTYLDNMKGKNDDH